MQSVLRHHSSSGEPRCPAPVAVIPAVSSVLSLLLLYVLLVVISSLVRRPAYLPAVRGPVFLCVSLSSPAAARIAALHPPTLVDPRRPFWPRLAPLARPITTCIRTSRASTRLEYVDVYCGRAPSRGPTIVSLSIHKTKTPKETRSTDIV